MNIKLQETGLTAQPVSLTRGNRKPCCMNKSKVQKEHAKSPKYSNIEIQFFDRRSIFGNTINFQRCLPI